MGYKVTLKPDDITADKLEQIDVIITGIRAYNVVPELKSKQQILFDFKGGKTMIVQYIHLKVLALPILRLILLLFLEIA
jgi:hypothetical protein